jgi:hypothetical protein
MSGGNKVNLSKKEIDDILRFGTEELFNQVRSLKTGTNVMIFLPKMAFCKIILVSAKN